jgi:hypothetical protein
MKKLKKKVIRLTGRHNDRHILQCDICWEMAVRGYRSEPRYWDAFFADKLKPIKYVLVDEKGNDVSMDDNAQEMWEENYGNP